MENQFSDDYVKRKELMTTLAVPKLSQVKMVAGLPLALVLFEECHPDLRVIFGLEPFLDGPKGELWQSPSDLLMGKVALKPPLTQKHIQALTHQGILDLGAAVEQKFLNEMQMEREKALKEREEFLNKVYEAGNVALVEATREEERKKYVQNMEDVKRGFDNKTCQLLWECYEQVRQVEEQLQVEFDSLNVLWQERLEQEVRTTVDKITEEFLEKMRKQEKTLVSTFKKQIKALKVTNKSTLEFQRIKCQEIVMQMKHKIHCDSIANLMYLLCKERRKCKNEKNDLKNHYLGVIRGYRSNLKRKNKLVKDLTRTRDTKIRQVNTRERCLIEILRQFQKFIYFALKASPTQGEFLLNINKLIKFELDDYCLHDSTKKERDFSVKQQSVEEFQEEVEEYCKKTCKEKDDDEEEKEEETKCSDILPAFYFNDKMYVREDFRDMLSAGITIDQRDPLWNPDVEELLNVFVKRVNSKTYPVGRVKSHHSSVHFHPDRSDTKSFSDNSTISDHILTVSPDIPSPKYECQKTDVIMSKASPISTRSITSKKSNPWEDPINEERVIRKVSLAPKSVSKTNSHTGSAKLSKTPPKHSDDEIRPALRGTSVTQSRLTLARDSIILHISNIERKSLQYMSKIVDQISLSKSLQSDSAGADALAEVEIEQPIEIYEDFSPETLSKADSRESLIKQTSRPTSRLLLATDSYELIKRSTIGLIDRSTLPTTDKQRKSLLTFAPKEIELEEITAEEKEETATVETVTKKSKTVKRKGTTKKKVTLSPKSTVRIAGSRKAKEHEKPIDEFTDERIRSLVNVMKENPSLICLFTPCFK